MSENYINTISPLDGYSREFDGVSIVENSNFSLVSIGFSNEARDRLQHTVAKAYKTDLPDAGQSTVSSDGQARLMWMQSDLVFLLFDDRVDQTAALVKEQLGNAACYTDQSDGWACIALSGEKSRLVLQRICAIDLHPGVFTDGAVARTTMEHIGGIILRNGPDSFLLFSAHSYAHSFLQMLEESIHNIL